MITLIIIAAVGMQTYVKRGLSGRVKNVVDHVGVPGDVGGAVLNLDAAQYKPYYEESKSVVTSHTESDRGLSSYGGLAVSGVDDVVSVAPAGYETTKATTDAD
ncbi:MAG: hypothetical protein KAI91_00095 [Candidatus Omnitrophica bacterium]|nr:hypothetical protein [Candidatus Omnitrophota bacterium]MCK5392711.1 hypothetical protein [Candidatus Omnitrophota bacterium]